MERFSGFLEEKGSIQDMAIELCSDSSSVSPRISFSYDLCQSDIVPVEPRHPLRSNSSGSSIDFDFWVRQSFDRESSTSADELFSEGKILPAEIKKKPAPTKSKECRSSTLLLPPFSLRNDSSSSDGSKKELLKKQTKSGCDDDEAEEKQQSGSRSFWGFKRSSSLNCGSGYGRSFCPLPLLSRCNSTGSTPAAGVKRAPLSKDSNGVNQKQHKQSSVKTSSPTTASMSSQKPPLLKKKYGNGIRVNPVLNVTSANLFGLSSILSNAKDKNKKK